MKSKTDSQPTLFVWRDETTESWGYPTDRWKLARCVWCSSHLRVTKVKHDPYPWTYDEVEHCPFCGWSHRYVNFMDEDRYPSGDVFHIRREIREFQVDDKEILLSEIGAHLRQRYSDVYALPPRRFEKLVEDVFKHLGYRTRLTQQSIDAGVDVYLLDKEGQIGAVVEVKRYRKERKVGVGIVDRIRGVQLREGVKHAKVVTSSTFSRYAIAAAEAQSPRESGFTLDLVDAGKLLTMLEVYDDRLLPLKEVVMRWELLRRHDG